MYSNLRRMNAGDRISAAAYNELVDAIEWLSRITVASPLTMEKHPAGIAIGLPQAFYPTRLAIGSHPPGVNRFGLWDASGNQGANFKLSTGGSRLYPAMWGVVHDDSGTQQIYVRSPMSAWSTPSAWTDWWCEIHRPAMYTLDLAFVWTAANTGGGTQTIPTFGVADHTHTVFVPAVTYTTSGPTPTASGSSWPEIYTEYLTLTVEATTPAGIICLPNAGGSPISLYGGAASSIDWPSWRTLPGFGSGAYATSHASVTIDCRYITPGTDPCRIRITATPVSGAAWLGARAVECQARLIQVTDQARLARLDYVP